MHFLRRLPLVGSSAQKTIKIEMEKAIMATIICCYFAPSQLNNLQTEPYPGVGIVRLGCDPESDRERLCLGARPGRQQKKATLRAFSLTANESENTVFSNKGEPSTNTINQKDRHFIIKV